MIKATKGRGFDVVLSSTSGEYFNEVAWKSLAPSGRLIDIGRVDNLDSRTLSMSTSKRNVAFFSFDLGTVNNERPEFAGR